MATITVLLVEDFIPFRECTRSLLEECPNLRVVGEVSDGLAAVAKAQELKPDLILMDIGLPRLDGVQATQHILRLVPSSKIVFLTQENNADVMRAALSLGACGYVIKQRAHTELVPLMMSIFEKPSYLQLTPD